MDSSSLGCLGCVVVVVVAVGRPSFLTNMVGSCVDACLLEKGYASSPFSRILHTL